METWCQATRCTCRRKFLRKQLVLPRSFEAHSTSSSLDADEPTVREDGQVWAFLMNEGWTFKESPNSNEWRYLKEDQSAYWKTRQQVVGTFERDDTDKNLHWISIVLFFSSLLLAVLSFSTLRKFWCSFFIWASISHRLGQLCNF